jgi:hypothetical protein
MWEWLSERTKMPKFVWFGVLAIMLAVAWQIFTAKNLLIDLNDRTLKVAHAERHVAEKEKRLVEVSDAAIEHLEELKTKAPHPEARDKFHVAQMAIRDDVKRPLIAKVDGREIKE